MSPQPKPTNGRYECGMCGGSGSVPDPQPDDRHATKVCPQCKGNGEL